jgi:hypothetical protein
VTGDNGVETVAAVLAHTAMAAKMLNDGIDIPLNETLQKDLLAYYGTGGDMESFARYVLENYDSSGDYWKLTKEGNLEYDGFATLRDADGNTIKSYQSMGLKSDTAIEGALLYILGIDPKDSVKVSAVQKLMVDSGIIHSFSDSPSDWFWAGEHSILEEKMVIQAGSIPSGLFQANDYFIWNGEPDMASSFYAGIISTLEDKNLTELNMGKTISLNSVALLYAGFNESGGTIERFIENTYGNPVNFLNYASVGENTSIAVSMLSTYHAYDQLYKVKVNQQLFNNLAEKGQNIQTSMFTGDVSVTQAFGITSDPIPLKRKKDSDPFYLVEDHPAIDFAGSGTTITTPGGFWTYEGISGYNAIYSLYGSDLRMRINHVNTNALTYKPGDIIGSAEGSTKLLDYPDKLYGTGSGTHVHIEYTLNLPYDGVYTRQYVNPNTLSPSQDYLEYYLSYLDKDKKPVRKAMYNRGF